jgi:GNAT superfamily N-acetyltransferase
MTIRAATANDLDRCVSMARHFLTQTEYRGRLGVDAKAIRRFGERVVSGELPDSVILLVERDGLVVGMFGAMVAPHPFSGELTGGDLFWWVEPKHRGYGVRLLAAAEAWAKERGAVRFQMVAPNDRVADFYLNRGYTKLEATYQRSL